jgi:hypothetical protein
MLSDEELERAIPRWYKALLDWNDAIQRKATKDELQRLRDICDQETAKLTNAELEHLSGGDEEKFRVMRNYCDAVKQGKPEAERQRWLEELLKMQGRAE